MCNVGAEQLGRGQYGLGPRSAVPQSGEDVGAFEGVSPHGGARVTGSLAGLRVLVVEDDLDARELVTAILEDAGAVVESAASAASGFAAVRTFQPQLLVSDIGMPDEDGYSLIRTVRASERGSDRDTPAVALTAYVRVQDRARAVAAGFNMFVEKPVDPVELISVIAGIVESRAERGGRRAAPGLPGAPGRPGRPFSDPGASAL